MDLVTVLFTLGLFDLELRSERRLLYEVRLVRVLWGEVEEEASKLVSQLFKEGEGEGAASAELPRPEELL